MTTDDKTLDDTSSGLTDRASRRRRRLREAEAGDHEPIAIVGMACRFPGGVTRRRSCGTWSPRAATRHRSFPADRGWDLDGLYDPTRTTRRHGYAARAGSCTTRRSSTPRSSGSRRARRWRWTRSSGCCWRRRGRRWSGRASTRPSLRGSGDRRVRGRDVPRLRHRAARTSRRRSRGSCVTGRRRQRGVRPGLLHASGWRARPSRWTRRARPRWWRCTWRARRCARASATLALAGGVTVMATPGHVRRVLPAARAGRRRPVQGVRRRRRTARGGPRASACWCWSGCPTRGGTGHRCWRWCAAARSTRTARRNGLTAPNGPVAAAGDPAGAGRRRAVGRRGGRGRGARHRHHAGRPDRGAGAAGDVRPGPRGTSGRCGWAR